MKNKRKFGELESTILQFVKNKKRATVAQIHALLKKEVAYTTVLTVMDRLFKKSYLNRIKEKNTYIYFLSKDYKSYFSNILKRIKQKFFDNSSPDMVSYLLEDTSNVTLEELNKIDELIKQAKKKKENE